MDILNANATLVNIISWIVFGLIVGFIVHLVDRADVKGGILGTLILGILGALLGGFLSNLLFGFGITGFNLQSFVVATLGGLLLAFIARIAFRSRFFRTRVTRMR